MALKWFCFFAKLESADDDKLNVMTLRHEENFEYADGTTEPFQDYIINNGIGEIGECFEAEHEILTDSEMADLKTKIQGGNITKINSSSAKVDQTLVDYEAKMKVKFPNQETVFM